MRNLMKTNKLACFFFLAFLWSWGWWSVLIFTTPADAMLSGNLPMSFIFLALLGGMGPTIAGVLTACLIGGREEAASLLRRRKKRNFSLLWAAAALFTVPLLTLVQTAVHALCGRDVSYGVHGVMLIMGFIWPLFSSFGEEIGWRGFALPSMLTRFGALKASLLLGLIWGLWHMPSDYIAYSSYGWLFIPMFLLLGPVAMTAHSIIMTFIFTKTNGSVLLMVLYHYTITMSGILSPSFAYNGQADDVLKTLISVTVIAVGALAIVLLSKTFRQDASFIHRKIASSAEEM